jgi:cysteine desulfurase
MVKKVYLDNNATTSLDPATLTLYVQLLQETYGNPSSVHSFGQEAKNVQMCARETLSSLFAVRSSEILFTSTATEALNLVIRGVFGTKPQGHLITSSVEHPAVFRTVKSLEMQGVEVTYLHVGAYGAPDPKELEAAIRPDTRLIALMAANNETGVLTDITQCAAYAQAGGVPLVVDGVAILGKAPLSMHPGISSICFSGHKFHAPKGTGFAVKRTGFKLSALITGGEQERGLRAGTENVPAISALAHAATLALQDLDHSLACMKSLRDYFEEGLLGAFSFAKINGEGPRIVNTSNICFEGLDGEALLMYLDLHGVAASLGSACSSGSLEPSRILLNMGLTRNQALSSLRFSLSRFTTKEEIDYALEVISKGVALQTGK